MLTRELIMEKIAPVQDPEIGLGVIDLGLIYDVGIVDESAVFVKMTLTTPYCPYGPTLLAQVKEAVEEVEGVTKAEVELVWDPPWNPSEMASDYAKDVLGIW